MSDILNDELVTAHLNLYAVLPAIKRYMNTKYGEPNRHIPNVGFTIEGVHDEYISLDDILSKSIGHKTPDLVMKFKHASQFNRFMDGRSWYFSLGRGWYRIDLLISTINLLLGLKKFLRPNQHRLTDLPYKKAYIEGLLLVGLQAVKSLSNLDSGVEQMLQKGPKGMVEFNTVESSLKIWCCLQNSNIEYGEGEAPIKANTTITFENLDAALKVIKGEVDNFSAMGLEYIKVRGYIPLADTVGDMLERVQRYLKP